MLPPMFPMISFDTGGGATVSAATIARATIPAQKPRCTWRGVPSGCDQAGGPAATRSASACRIASRSSPKDTGLRSTGMPDQSAHAGSL
jgi:hypothetical protein